jgi:hypothetical protein
MSYYSNPEQLRAAVETASAMRRLLDEYTVEELDAMGINALGYAEDPEASKSDPVVAEHVFQANQRTRGRSLAQLLIREHGRSVGLGSAHSAPKPRPSVNWEALAALQNLAIVASEADAPVVNVADAPLASLSTAGIDSLHQNVLTPKPDTSPQEQLS